MITWLDLVRAIERLRTELPALVGDDWREFEARLDALLPQLTADPAREPLARAQILDLFASYPAAHERLLDVLAELRSAESLGTAKGWLPESTRGTPLQPAAPTVTRYSDIHAPAQAQVEKRFPVIVGLTRQPSAESAVAQAFETRVDLPVQVRLGPTRLELLSAPAQELTIHPERDSEPVVFYFRASQPGPARIVLDFLQGGHFLGQVVLAMAITAGPAGEETERLPGQRLRLPADVPPPDRILFIHYDRFEGQPSLFFTLDQAGGGSRTFPPVKLQADPAQDAAWRYAELTTLQARGQRGDLTPEDVLDEVKRLGWNLWRDLIPPRLQDLYTVEREAWRAGSLLIVSDEPYFPWELVWPYDPVTRWSDPLPWCATLRLTRWLSQGYRGNGHEGPPGRLRVAGLACLASSAAALASAPQERDRVRQLVLAHRIADLSPERADRGQVLRLLRTGRYGWLHVAAHGGFAEDQTESRSAIRLEDDGTLNPDDLVGPEIEGHIGDARPGFFFNTCHGGRQGWALSRLGGWADRLIGAGAGLFIAPLWTVEGSLALRFAETFYGGVLEGQTVAAAALQARLAARQDGDPTWLAYSVYAHPNARVGCGG